MHNRTRRVGKRLLRRSAISYDRSSAQEDPRSTPRGDRKSTRLNSSHLGISYAVFCLKKRCRVKSNCSTPARKWWDMPRKMQRFKSSLLVFVVAVAALAQTVFLKHKAPAGLYPLPLHGPFPF